jgi:phosphoglycerol transferase
VLDASLPPGEITRAGSLLDVYPTLLDALGLLDQRQPKAGLGVSLLSDNKNLVELLGVETVDELIRKDRALRARLWGHEEPPP